MVAQLAITQSYEFDPRGVLPAARVVYLDAAGQLKSFDVEWEAEAKWWARELLPKSVMFYLNHVLPRALATVDLEAAAPSSLAGAPPATPLSPPGGGARGDHGGPSPAAAGDGFCSPTIAVGKKVWDTKRGLEAEVLELGPGGAVLKREGKTPLKKKLRDCKSLVVLPVDNPQRPQKVGQRVLVNRASLATVQHVAGPQAVALELHGAAGSGPRGGRGAWSASGGGWLSCSCGVRICNTHMGT